jgi:predicted nucleic acid-binding protein
MAASPVLADSSYYITMMREGIDPLRALALAAETRDIVICGVIRCEVGRGMKVPRVRERLHGFWDVMINVPTDNRLWESAEELLWQMDRRGATIPLTDAVIACCAQRVGATVLTFDHHFRMIENLNVVDRLEM